jgi:hypothetical protein
LAPLLEAAAAQLGAFSGQQLANSLWALAVLGQRDEALLGLVAARLAGQPRLAVSPQVSARGRVVWWWRAGVRGWGWGRADGRPGLWSRAPACPPPPLPPAARCPGPAGSAAARLPGQGWRSAPASRRRRRHPRPAPTAAPARRRRPPSAGRTRSWGSTSRA